MTDHDSPWKETLDVCFEAFLAFFFPWIYQAVDWPRGFEQLDKELQQIMPDAETGRRYVDKLVKVWRKDGVEAWVLIHVEIQHNPDDDFGRRMFTYHYRLLDRYARPVASLAVLADDRADWRPDRYNEGLWGCATEFRFPVVKLLDYASNWQSLESDSNPFAIVVLTELKARETRKDPLARKEWKFRLFRGLFERGIERDEIRQVLKFIDWIMTLPEPLASAFDQEIFALEQEKVMPYITSWERHGIEKGKIEGLHYSIESYLESKFGSTGSALVPETRKVIDVAALESLWKALLSASTVDEFRAYLPRDS